ncbi:MAG: amidohydrolase [Alcanivorax sp.]|nr:amidohydrolase [Alcanivorax sp.]UWN49904.1 N-acyl-L-amino acid amidohydrolase [Alcanivorax sp. ALC70]
MSVSMSLWAPLAAALLLVCAGAQAATDLKERVAELAEAQGDQLESTFKHLHANPELGFQETETAKMVSKRLKKLGYKVHTGIGGTGVAAVLKNGDGPVVMFRSDMDGLPLKEETDLDYASRKQVTLDDGSKVHVTHACGHDAHVSWLLGIARVMRDTRDDWSGTLVLVAQPAEELLEGAQAMVDDGLYDKVPKPELLISAHVFPAWPSGTVAVRAGRRMAGSDQLDVTLHGVGGHGSMPQVTVDPVVMGARSVMAYQTIVSRNVDPQKPAVLTVGASQIGEANNVISETGVLKLNLRWYEKSVRDQMIEAIKRETNGIARAAGVAEDNMPDYTFKGYSEPVYNDETLARHAQGLLAEGLGKEAVMPGFPPVMGSEDFPMLVAGIEDTKTLFMEVGGGPADVVKTYMATGKLPPMNHNPKFEIIEPRRAITTAVKANSLLLLDALAPQ